MVNRVTIGELLKEDLRRKIRKAKLAYKISVRKYRKARRKYRKFVGKETRTGEPLLETRMWNLKKYKHTEAGRRKLAQLELEAARRAAIKAVRNAKAAGVPVSQKIISRLIYAKPNALTKLAESRVKNVRDMVERHGTSRKKKRLAGSKRRSKLANESFLLLKMGYNGEDKSVLIDERERYFGRRVRRLKKKDEARIRRELVARKQRKEESAESRGEETKTVSRVKADALRRELKAKKQAINDLQGRLTKAQEESTRSRERLKRGGTVVAKKISKLSRELKEAAVRESELNARIADLTKRVEEGVATKEELWKVLKERESLNRQVEKLTASNSELRGTYMAEVARRGRAEVTASRHYAALGEARERIAAMRAEVAGLQERLKSAEERWKDSETVRVEGAKAIKAAKLQRAREAVERRLSVRFDKLQKTLYNRAAVDGRYQVLDLRRKIDTVKGCLQRGEGDGATVMGWARDEAARERSLGGNETSVAKYEAIADSMAKKANNPMSDPQINRQARRVLELLRRRLKMQRQSALSNTWSEANALFARAVGPASTKVKIKPPPVLLDQKGRVLPGHKVKLPSNLSDEDLKKLDIWARGKEA